MTRQARIEALLGTDLATREVYRVRRGVVGPEDLPKPGGKRLCAMPKCWRCGAICSPSGVGTRAALTVLSRERGTMATGIRPHYVHVGCIPTDDSAPLGIPARKVRRG